MDEIALSLARFYEENPIACIYMVISLVEGAICLALLILWIIKNME